MNDKNPQNNNKKKKIVKRRLHTDDVSVNKSKLKFYKAKRRRQRVVNGIFVLRGFLKFVLICGLFYLCSKIMIAGFWYLPQNIFTAKNKNLMIIGNSITPESKILEILNKKQIPQKPIYLISTKDYEKEIEKLSPIKKAFVRRYIFPARLEITVEEKIPVITIAPNPTAPEIAAITKDCSIITKDFLPVKSKKYHTFKVLTYDDYRNWSKTEILSLNLLAQRIEDFSGEKVVYLDIRNKNDVYFQLETVKIRIGELNSTLKQRITRLSSIMPQIENEKRRTDYIDLRWDNSTYLKQKSKETIHVIPSASNASVKTIIKEKSNKEHTAVKKEEQPKTYKPSASTSQKPQQKTQTIDDVPQINIQTVE